MKFKDIKKELKNIPWISTENANFLYNFIIENKINNILELGIAHGTATCYMAAALEELGEGTITAVDLTGTSFTPSAEEQITKYNFDKYVDIVRMKTGYNWFLHDKIKSNSQNNICKEEYDLCIIDGAKNWTIDSSAFYLVDKLLKEDGYIIFDDYTWTYEIANKTQISTDRINHDSLSVPELKTPHIKEIFDLCVMQHPNYSDFKIFYNNQWAMAKKTLVDKKYSIHSYEHNNSLYMARSIEKIYKKIAQFKNNKMGRILIYGNGSLGKIIASILENNIVGFIDQNAHIINNQDVFSIDEINSIDYDKIIISVLGHEESIKRILHKNNVPNQIIITL
ncbi:hypothetical protein CP965_07335 [Halarcobacter mediterraneus]|uniref:Methyltransferase n=1 Tax=Halarcobacter mediterraneus TaxID=2023153 RepID=A0A4Q1AUL3_9BACT|nr:class I SAM-dependent methyltransferase [Halarcobacter mediterraneus]RXK13602.1 hypothetical protein CP965_07335 [Halarcobacter mediterraneus]